jgi:hypothetical protein
VSDYTRRRLPGNEPFAGGYEWDTMSGKEGRRTETILLRRSAAADLARVRSPGAVVLWPD